MARNNRNAASGGEKAAQALIAVEKRMAFYNPEGVLRRQLKQGRLPVMEEVLLSAQNRLQ